MDVLDPIILIVYPVGQRRYFPGPPYRRPAEECVFIPLTKKLFPGPFHGVGIFRLGQLPQRFFPLHIAFPHQLGHLESVRMKLVLCIVHHIGKGIEQAVGSFGVNAFRPLPAYRFHLFENGLLVIIQKGQRTNIIGKIVCFLCEVLVLQKIGTDVFTRHLMQRLVHRLILHTNMRGLISNVRLIFIRLHYEN